MATLEGSVGDAWQCAAAEDITRSVRGVRDVDNRLVVDVDQLIDDEESSIELMAAIRGIGGEAAADIRVAVCDRTAVLSGTVPSLPTKEYARRIVTTTA